MLAASRKQASVQEGSSRLLDREDIAQSRSEAMRYPQTIEPLMMKVADCKREREQALQLLQSVYIRAGLAQANMSRLRVLKQHLAESTDIIVGMRGSRVVFTVSLVGDGQFGLPLETVFDEEVASMRAEGFSLAEVSCLANDCGLSDERGRFETFLHGMSLLARVARGRGIERLLLAAHPRHAKLHERLLGCVRCSGSREYAAVRGNPAVLCMHDFVQADRKGFPCSEWIYSRHYEPWQLGGDPMSSAERQYFEQYLPDREYEFMPLAG